MQIRPKTNFIFAIALFLWVGAVSSSRAADLLLLRGHGPNTLEDNQIHKLAGFYGVNLHTVDMGSADIGQAVFLIKSPDTLAILVEGDVLQDGASRWILAALQQRKGKRIPAMLFGISEQTVRNELKLWSSGAIDACTGLQDKFRPTLLKVNEPIALTRQLMGIDLPPVTSPLCKMELASVPTVETVLTAKETDGASAPVLVRNRSQLQQVFFVPREKLLDPNWTPAGVSDSFSSMAPFILFLSNTIAEYGWHSPGHYANLTIDDAWLIQPYGYLDYKALLIKMEEHNFHTTAAFVPWNFDRSRPEVVALFQSHPDRYSICVHGNNHAHREFGEYRRNSLSDQIADVKQGVARMERFTALTHIPYDRFMVFPHAVAPEPTFAALSTYGFLGTANSSNIPLDKPFPNDPIFFLRPYTTNYAGLLSLYRYPAAGEVPHLEVAIHAFLGNPILFYDHSSLFSSGISAFDAHADFINQIQPDTKWTNLGEIARHSYLLRKRTNGDVDVLMLSREMELENSGDTAQVFYVRRNDGARLSGTLTADGSSTLLSGSSEERIVIPAHESRLLRMTYANDLDLAHEEVKSRNAYVYALRMISDLRDLYISKSSLGESFVKSYYRYRGDSAELFLERYCWMLVVFVVVGFAAVRYYRIRALRIPAKGRGNKAI
jgi:hypothetical protein